MIINPYRFASGPTVLLRDTFTGAAGDLEAHSPEVGGAWVEADLATGTTFDLDGSGGVTSVLNGQRVAYVECSAANVINAVTFINAPTDAGPMVNFVDGSNYWMMRVAGPNVQIYEKTGGGFTLRSSGSSGGATAGGTATVTASGDDISWTFSAGGSGSYTGAPRAHKTATKHGIRTNSAQTSIFDEIEVTSS